MKRGSYKIQDGYSGSGGGKGASEYVWCESAARPPDSSYSACLLALILFLFLCVVIMLAAWPWKAGKPTTDAETDNPIRDGLSAGNKRTVLTTLPSAPVESSTVNDTLNPTSFSVTELSESKHPTFLPTETETSALPTETETSALPTETETSALPTETESTTFAAVEVEGKSDSEMVGRTMKPDTHEALVDEKEGNSTSSEEEIKEYEFVIDDHCWTTACKSHASQMLALMNYSTDACHDIYLFACGGMRGEGSEWIGEDLKEVKPIRRVQEMLHKHNPSTSSTKKKFETFIGKCIHTDEPLGVRIQQAKGIINNVGPFLLNKSENGSITDLLANLLLHNFPTIFDMLLEPENPDMLILKISLPELMSPLGHSSEDDVTLNGWKSSACLKKATERPRDGNKEVDLNARYNTYIQCNRNTSKYVEEVEEALRMLKLFKKEDKALEDTFIEETVFFLEKELLKEIQENLPNQTDRNVNMTKRPSNVLFLSDLQSKYPLVGWENLVSKLVGDSMSEALEDVQVNLYYESFFEHIFKVLEFMSVRKLYNGLLAMFAHEVYYGLVVNRNSCFREEYCFAVASDLMPEAVSSLFLSSFRKDQLEEFKLEINYLYMQLKSEMESEVEKVTWLTDKSRKKILKKISEMKLIDDGGCPYFLDDEYLDKQFDDYPLNSSYLEDAASLIQRRRKKMYSAVSEKPLKQIWSLFVLPYSTKPKAFYELNAIVIPYGVMLQPFSTSKSSRYLQMATVGNQIAKVMWQHFDETGTSFNYKGSRRSFTADELSSMGAVTDCLEKQFQTQKLVIDEGITLKYKLPESLSVNSRLADIGGIHLAFNTMMKNNSGDPLPWVSTHFSKEQLYFLTIAQSMCTKSSIYQYAVSMFEEEDLPPFLRVEDMARNSKEFIDAFSCDAKKATQPACDPFTVVEETKAKPFVSNH